MKGIYNKILFAMTTAFFAAPAFAQEATAHAEHSMVGGYIAIGAGLCIGVAALGGALAQGRAAAAALDGVARNPAASGKLTVPLILSLALIESLVIYALIIAFQLVGKI
jgi:F-type H+-transporting ATPase subunit c